MVTGFTYQTITGRNADGQLSATSLAEGQANNTYSAEGLARIARISINDTTTATPGAGAGLQLRQRGNLTRRTMSGARFWKDESFSATSSTADAQLAPAAARRSPGRGFPKNYDNAGNLLNKGASTSRVSRRWQRWRSYLSGSNRLCNIGGGRATCNNPAEQRCLRRQWQHPELHAAEQRQHPRRGRRSLTLSGYARSTCPQASPNQPMVPWRHRRQRRVCRCGLPAHPAGETQRTAANRAPSSRKSGTWYRGASRFISTRTARSEAKRSHDCRGRRRGGDGHYELRAEHGAGDHAGECGEPLG